MPMSTTSTTSMNMPLPGMGESPMCMCIGTRPSRTDIRIFRTFIIDTSTSLTQGIAKVPAMRDNQRMLQRSKSSHPLSEETMLTPEQLAAAHTANSDMLFGLTRKAFEGVETLVELNLQATRAALRDSADQTQAL
ncbi:phasin family protein, partial [Cutibacterium acnes]